MKQRILKFLYLLIVFTLLVIPIITIKENKEYQKNNDEIQNIEKMLKDIDSYNEDYIYDYINEYKKSNNLVYSINKINHPDYYNNEIKTPTLNSNNNSYLTLINKKYYLDNDYQIGNLSIIQNVKKINRVDEIMMLESTALNNYFKLYEKALEENIELVIYSAYRNLKKQNELYNNRQSELVAKPGHSEHHTGLVIDIATLDSGLTIHFEHTNSFKFLDNYAHLYGFILRYPKGKEYITGYNYEPWHYRYVGIEHAKIIKEKNLTLEEYLYLYIPLL